MNKDDAFKLPRLYVEADLSLGADIPLSAEQAHYFKTVLRRQDGDKIRIFNGRDGEWLCALDRLGKKSGYAVAREQLKAQPDPGQGVHLYFAPIKKSRMDWLVEKAVELGATDLHPVITQNTEIRDIRTERVAQQIAEAAEQCERLDQPRLHDPIKLHDIPGTLAPDTLFLAAIERGPTTPIHQAINTKHKIAVLIGPEGGFTTAEIEWITDQATTPVSLGPRILRCETAVCVALTAIMLSDNK